MKLIECECGHRSHPVIGKRPSFLIYKKTVNHFNCAKCRSLLQVELKDGEWVLVKILPNPRLDAIKQQHVQQ